jgi:carboxypeptidase Q
MRFKYRVISALTFVALASMPAAAQVDETNRLVDEGMNRSQVMSLAQEMTDDIGPRLTNSPAMRRAEAWAIEKFNGWGLQNVRRDPFDFGRGWEIVSSSARMTATAMVTISSPKSPAAIPRPAMSWLAHILTAGLRATVRPTMPLAALW